MNYFPIIILLPLLLRQVKSDVMGEFPIRKSSVMSSWQSSFGDGQTCFYSRSEADESSVLSDPSSSYRLFHSAGKNEADDGFHWFAVQLKEPLLIRSVTVKGREDNVLWPLNRIIGIEIWTSYVAKQLFSGNHCNSRDTSRQFNESRQQWTLCGVINRTLGSINSGEIITVPCDSGTQSVQYLLLRKYVSNKTSGTNDDDVMSFADLRLQAVQQSTTVATVASAPETATAGTSVDEPADQQFSNNKTASADLGGEAAAFVASVAVMSATCIGLVCGAVLLRLRRRDAPPSSVLQTSRPSRVAERRPRQPGAAAVTRATVEPPRQRLSELLPCDPDAPECTYATVSQSKPASGLDSELDSISACTVFIEIVNDGD